MKTKSALSYFGSDSEVADKLAGLLNHCKHVTIPFVGGGAILPHLTARAIVANDANYQAINFYRVLSGLEGENATVDLINRCENTLSHPAELNRALLITQCPDNHSVSSAAWAYWALCWIGRKGKGGTKDMGGMPSVRRTANGGTNATRIRAAAEDLHAWAEHFQRCEWTQEDFEDCLSKVSDTEGCGVYCDPPWVELGNNYLYSFTTEDHIRLRDCLDQFENATVVVRYGDHPMIREIYSSDWWRIIEAESRTQTNKVKGEIWITNKAYPSTAVESEAKR